MSKPTPGPWTVDQRCIQAPDGNIALLNLARPEAETRANAKLIAQAPLLPEAIEALRESVSGLEAFAAGATWDTIEKARAILQRYEEAAK